MCVGKYTRERINVKLTIFPICLIQSHYLSFSNSICIKLTDMRYATFKPRKYDDIFPGTGHHLGGKEVSSHLLPSTQQAVNGGLYKETIELPGPTIPLNTFLSQLPQCVIRGGKIMDVRNGIQNVLQVSNYVYTYVGALY